ncbi:hypothetical protein EDD18DRAFT_1013410, partial [Armillaria luteobubalina]
ESLTTVTFTDGRKYEALSKQLIFIAHAIFTAANDPIGYILLRALHVYMELDVYASLTLHTSDTLRDGWARIPIFASTLTRTDTIPKEKKLKCWNFLKAHSHQHLFDDIEAKGVTLNYNTKPNESMHGSFKESYQHCTNFKNVDEQILRVDDWYNAMTYIQQQVNHHDNIEKEGDEDDEGETRDSNEDKLAPALSTSSEVDYAATASLHGGSLSVKIRFALFLFCYITLSLILLFQISLYGMSKVNYSSIADWSLTTDILQCLPSFNYHPRYDFVLLETNQGPMFTQLVLIFECVVHEKVYPLMLVWPFKEAIGPIMKKDRDLGFYRVRTRMKGNPLIVSIYSDMAMNRTINRGERTMKDYLVVDMIDADMFLRMQNL